MKLRNLAVVGMFAATLPFTHLSAQEMDPAPMDPAEVFNSTKQRYGLKEGVFTGKMQGVAEIQVPEGYMFVGPSGAQQIMQDFGNLPGEEIGFIAPASDIYAPDSWCIIFEFADIGYVKDDEKDALDADKMMKEMKAGQKEANKQLESRGLDTLDLTGWVVEPNYNPETNNLEYGIRLMSRPGNVPVVNHSVKILGRRGYVQATLLCSPEVFEASLSEARQLLKGFKFQSGESYAEFREGDKIAKYGLTALVVGGTAAALAKSGLLGRLLKPILFGLAAIGAFIGKIFGRRGR